MQTFQEENPNNARVKINYNNLDSPVTFEYVGTDKPFIIAYRLFRRFFTIYYLLAIALLCGLLMDRYLVTKDIVYWYYAFGLFIVVFYIIPALLALLFTKTRLIRKLPLLQEMGKTKYLHEFKSDEVVDNKIEIPLYANVFLGYQLFDDFSDKIERIEVIEHPFNILTFKTKLFSKNKRILKPNEYLWKATFYFKSKPENGILKVIFH